MSDGRRRRKGNGRRNAVKKESVGEEAKEKLEKEREEGSPTRVTSA